MTRHRSADAVVRQLRHADDLFGPSNENNLASMIPGPMMDDVGDGKRFKGKLDMTWALADAAQRGCNHLVWAEWAKRCGTSGMASPSGMASNIVAPIGVFGRDEKTGSIKPFLSQQILVSDPQDCERLAKKHTGKQPNFLPFYLDQCCPPPTKTTGDTNGKILMLHSFPKRLSKKIFR